MDVGATGGSGGVGGTGGGGGTGGTGGGGSGGTGGGGGSGGMPIDMAIDQPVDQRVDLPPDMMVPPDVMEAPPARMAVLVVANDMTPTAADMQWRTSLMGRGLTTRIVDDGAPAAVDGVALVVIAASSDSNAVAMKYRTVPIPVMVIEPAAFDNMGMTTGDNYGQDNGTQITISHGRPPDGRRPDRQRRRADHGRDAQLGRARRRRRACGHASTGWPTGRRSSATPRAPPWSWAPRPPGAIGFFAAEPAASRLTDNGKKLLDAAIDWALVP